GTYAVTFKLYNVANGGSALWTENRSGGNSVAVSNGLFSVMLGGLTPIPQTVFVNNSSLWLGGTIASDPEMTPRVQLGSAPFAVQAMTVPDGSIGLSKIANDAAEPDRTTYWYDGTDQPFDANGTLGAVYTITTDIVLTVPAGKAYYYWINYSGNLE